MRIRIVAEGAWQRDNFDAMRLVCDKAYMYSSTIKARMLQISHIKEKFLVKKRQEWYS